MTNRIRATLISISLVLMSYVVVGGLLGKSETSSEKTYRDLGVYSEVLNRIKQEYVTDPDLKKVTDGAIRGLLESLDPYSTYLTPEQYQDYLQHPDPGPADVGIFISKRMGYATVVAVLPGSPAEKAGVKPGDLIDEVDGVPTRQFSVLQLERMMAGQPDSTVKLTLVREGHVEPLEHYDHPRRSELPAGFHQNDGGRNRVHARGDLQQREGARDCGQDQGTRIARRSQTHSGLAQLRRRRCAGGGRYRQPVPE